MIKVDPEELTTFRDIESLLKNSFAPITKEAVITLFSGEKFIDTLLLGLGYYWNPTGRYYEKPKEISPEFVGRYEEVIDYLNKKYSAEEKKSPTVYVPGKKYYVNGNYHTQLFYNRKLSDGSTKVFYMEVLVSKNSKKENSKIFFGSDYSEHNSVDENLPDFELVLNSVKIKVI